MTAGPRRCSFRVPGKVVVNGGYIVCMGEMSMSLCIDCYVAFVVSARPSATAAVSVVCERTRCVVKSKVVGGVIEIIESSKAEVSEFYKGLLSRFLEVFAGELGGDILIELEIGDAFFMENGSKTGIGLSSCLTVGFVRALLWAMSSNLDPCKVAVDVSRRVNPLSSGVDVATCSMGSILYSFDEVIALSVPPDLLLLLGSRGRSTDTGASLRKLSGSMGDASTWERLKNVNRAIVEAVRSGSTSKSLRPYYMEYLDELRRISPEIVPDFQYGVLLRTFEYGIVGCGVSGAGGEDCVWCLADEAVIRNVSSYWKGQFYFTRVFHIK